MSILEEIVQQKKNEISLLKKNNEIKYFDEKYQGPNFLEILKNRSELRIIAEIKKASPSAGIIQSNFDPIKIANLYAQGGADAFSILTDEKYFQGSLEYLKSISNIYKNNIPSLRKDFIIDSIQINQAVYYGASAILLIVACLDLEQLNDLYQKAISHQLNVIVEVHNELELEKALSINPQIIGINNRDLNTFQVDIRTTNRLSQLIPNHILKIAESGIKQNSDITYLADCGIHCILVGESLMKENAPEKMIKEWKQLYLNIYKDCDETKS